MSVRVFHRLVSLSLNTHYKLYTLLFSTTPQQSTIPGPDPPNKQVFACEIDSKLANLENPEKPDSVASFLKESGFSNTFLENTIKTVPKALTSNLELNIKAKITILKNLGLSTDQIAHVVSASPRILTRVSDHNMERSLSALKNVLGDKLNDSRILKNFGWYVRYDLEKTLVPNLEFMRSLGIKEPQIMQLFYNYPTFLLHKTKNCKEFVRRVDEMGVDRESKMFVYAVRTIGSMTIERWEQKMDIFRGLRYTEGDILSAFRSFPNVFALSDRKIKDTAEFLINSGKYDSSFIAKYPYVFIFSLEKRVKPRLQVMEILEREEILKFKPIPSVFVIPDAKFFAKYVSPYLGKVKDISFMVNEAATTT